MGSKTARLTQEQRNLIEKLLVDGAGISETCKIVGVSNTPVYKIAEEKGIWFKKRIGKRNKIEEPSAVMVDEFVCPGLRYCVTCKHIFELVCPYSRWQ